jgi:hypothetical protein
MEALNLISSSMSGRLVDAVRNHPKQLGQARMRKLSTWLPSGLAESTRAA